MVAGRTHHPAWDREACMTCGACRQACPAWVQPELLAEPDSLRARVAREHPFPAGRRRRDVPACTAACPLNQDVAGYMAAIAAGDMGAARDVILETNPLPGVLSRVCNRSCMRACVRSTLDSALDIRGLKAVPFEGEARARPIATPRRGDERVAIVGSGPAGLAAAAVLARAGVRPLVLERDDEPGGLLRHGIPEFDLPRRVLDADIARILAAGVALETGVHVDFPREVDALLDSGILAVIVATGAGRGKVTLERGGGLAGVVDVIAFMRGAAGGIRGPVVVEGDGPAAVAAARTAARAGAATLLVISRPRALAGADAESLSLAEADGVEIVDSTVVEAAEGSKRLEAVRLVGCEMEAAGGGRVVPRQGGRGSLHRASTLVSAGRRGPDPALADLRGAGLTPIGTLAVDRATLATARPGLYAAGDAASGPKTVVEAVATGMKAARSVIQRLGVVP